MRFYSHFCSFSFQSQPQRRDQEEAVAAVAVHQATAVDAHHLAQATVEAVHQATAAVDLILEDLQVVHTTHHLQDRHDLTAVRQVRQDPTAVRQAHLEFAAVQRHHVQRLHVRQSAQLLHHQHRDLHQLYVHAMRWQHVRYAHQDHV